jgi:hypothetical protein
MPTREEMLRGTVRVNNERVNSESIASRSPREVPGDDSQQGDQRTGKHGTLSAPVQGTVPVAKESVWAYAARREGEIRAALQEVEDQTSRLTAELHGLADERAKLEEELLLVTPLIIMQENNYGLRSSAEASQPQDVLPDTGEQGRGRSSEVRGDDNGGGHTPRKGGKRKAPPNSS